jgi:hypothetical protein
MKRRERLHVCAVILVLGAVTLRARAEDQSTSITRNLGSHAYVVPRDLIETIFESDYSRVPNANPNWPHDPVVRLAVQWPEFRASEFTESTGAERQDKAKRRITISMIEGSTRTIAQIIERLDELILLRKLVTPSMA